MLSNEADAVAGSIARERGRALIGRADFGRPVAAICPQALGGRDATVLHVPTISDPSDRLATGRFGRGMQRMNEYGSTSLFGMLMATSLVAGASAFEINQQRALSTAGAPAFTYPSFRYVAPGMQDAWRRARLGKVSDDAGVQPAGESATSTPEAVLDAAQRAMTRAEQASREAAAVRERAEELSRRFDAGGAESTAYVAPAEVAVPTVTASINTNANPSDVAQPVEHSLAPADERAAHDSIAAWKDSTRVIEDMPAKSAKPANTKPAKAAKRRIGSPPPHQPVQAAVQNGSSANRLIAVDFAVPPPDSDPMLPREMRSFGWNAQP